MKNNATRTIRSEEITIDVRICAALAANRSGEVYLAAIAPDMELTIITLDETPDILPCFDEDDACLNLPDTSLLLCYNPAQVLKMRGKHYLTGPVILARTNMDGEVISLTIDEVYLFQKYLASHSITLMADDQKLPCMTTAETRRPKPPAFMWRAGKPCRLKISATCFGAAWGREKATLPPVSPTPLWKKRLPSA